MFDTVEAFLSGNETFFVYRIEAWVEDGEEFTISVSQPNHCTCSYVKGGGLWEDEKALP